MNNTTATATDPHPIELFLLAVLITAAAVFELAAALAALHRRRRPALPPARSPLAALPPAPQPQPQPEPLAALPVRELRRIARAAGLPRCLSHSGRRADLLAALAATG
jgi:hypothetical protein